MAKESAAEDRARRRLRHMIQVDGSLHQLTEYVYWDRNSGDCVTLDGHFSSAELEALAWWVRHKGKAPDG
jgi:hypothetical protein